MSDGLGDGQANQTSYNQQPGIFGLGGPYSIQNYNIDQNSSQIPGYDDLQGKLQSLYSQSHNRGTPYLNQLKINNDNQARQGNLAQMLQSQAGQGYTPIARINQPTQSLAQLQLQQGTDQSLSDAMALGQSQQGVGAAAGLRGILTNQANIAQQGANQAAQLRAQETNADRQFQFQQNQFDQSQLQNQQQYQLGTEGQLGSLLGQARGQDVSTAGLDLNAQANNQNATLAQQGLNDAQGRFALGDMGNLAQAQQAANMGLQQMNVNQNLNYNQLGQAAYSGNQTQLSNLGNSVIGSLGKVAGLSTGGQVLGRALMRGNSPINDTVPTMLSPGEIVIPRTDANSPQKAKEFVMAQLLMKHRMGGR